MAFGITKVPAPVKLSEKVVRDFIAKYPPIRGERPKRSGRIKKMVKLLEGGNFVMCDWAIIHCLENDTWYRGNGQHSSYTLQCLLDGSVPQGDDKAKIKKIEADFPLGVPVVIKECFCDTEAELIDVFDMFDNQMSSRSSDDKLGIFMAAYDELRFTEVKIVKDALQGVDFLRKHDKSQLHESLRSVQVRDASDRGQLLSVNSVREFIEFIVEHPVTPYPYRANAGAMAAVYEAWLPRTKESEIEVEALLYEAQPEAEKSGKAIRAGLSKKGHGADWFWSKSSTALRKIRTAIATDQQTVIKLLKLAKEADIEEAA